MANWLWPNSKVPPSNVGTQTAPAVSSEDIEWQRLDDMYVLPRSVLKKLRDDGRTSTEVRAMISFIGGGMAGQAQTTQPSPICQFTICFAGGRAGPDPARLLQERLRVDGAGIPASKARNIHLFVGADRTTAIVFKENGEHVAFEDETNLFPSDKLVAAFHLLLKAS